MFGLDWGVDQEIALMRFEGTAPVAHTKDDLEWLTFDIAARLVSEKAFLPSAMASAPDRDKDRVTLSFQGGALVSIRLTFGYAFTAIGQDPDTLSDMAMAAIARAEWAALLGQMACRYGAPAYGLDAPARFGTWSFVGSVFYMSPAGAPTTLRFGHDATGLVGDLTTLAPSLSDTGI